MNAKYEKFIMMSKQAYVLTLTRPSFKACKKFCFLNKKKKNCSLFGENESSLSYYIYIWCTHTCYFLFFYDSYSQDFYKYGLSLAEKLYSYQVIKPYYFTQGGGKKLVCKNNYNISMSLKRLKLILFYLSFY